MQSSAESTAAADCGERGADEYVVKARRKAGDRNRKSKGAHKHHARLQGRNDACAAFEILEQLFGVRFAGLRIFFDAGFVSRFRGGFAHGEKRAKHEKEQKQQQGEGEG